MKSKFLRVRCNAMNLNSIDHFLGARSVVLNETKNVYFLRLTGFNDELEKNLYRCETDLISKIEKNEMYYSRMNILPALINIEESNYYSNCYNIWLNDKKIILSSLKEDNFLQERLSFAIEEVLTKFKEYSNSLSMTMEKNFVVKLLFWFDKTASDILKKDINNFKFILQNISKKQEYFFAYLLTLMGIDVLLLQINEDIDIELDNLNLSYKTSVGEFHNKVLQNYDYEKLLQKFKESETTAKNVNADASVLKNQNEEKRKVVDVRHPKREQVKQNNVQNSMISAQTTNVKNSQRGAMPVSDNANKNQRRLLEYEELANLASSIVMLACYDSEGKMMSSGSGIMIGRGGYILTNNHVVRGNAYSYGVRIENDEHTYEVTDIIKYNTLLDLAIVRIDKELNPIPIYNSSQKLARGQKVVAIGSPLGLFNSVSDGIISGFRKFDDVDMIQFTAPISPGSSGGAVLNLYGEVIGISTAGFDGGQNINLAVGYEYINQFVRGFV